MSTWLLKRRHYSGADSVISRYSNLEEAQEDADTMNTAYQANNYYVEPYDPAKAAGFSLANATVAKLIAPRERGGQP